MPNLAQAKTLGQVGSILVLFTALPTAGGIIGIVGFILLLLAIRDIAEAASDKAVFRNYLIAIGLAIVAIVTGVLVIAGSVLTFIGLKGIQVGPNFNASTIPAGDWAGLIGSVLLGLAVIWVLMLVSAVYVRRSYTEIASRLKVDQFNTAGLLYLVGAATTIILVGFLILLVAQIFVVIAFFSIDEKIQLSPPTQAAGMGGASGA